MRYVRSIIVVSMATILSGCAGMSSRQQSTLSGGALGAAGGALVGGVVGGSPAVGATLGGAAGALTGYILGDRSGRYRHRR